MRAIVQRASQAHVVINGKEKRSIERGLVILLGISEDDTHEDSLWIIKKLCSLRVFDDADGFMNKSITDIGGEFLVISQFTLFASVKKGTRPSFSNAAPPEVARPVYNDFIRYLEKEFNRPVTVGEFAADMQVSLTNDGPVTLIVDSKNKSNK